MNKAGIVIRYVHNVHPSMQWAAARELTGFGDDPADALAMLMEKEYAQQEALAALRRKYEAMTRQPLQGSNDLPGDAVAECGR